MDEALVANLVFIGTLAVGALLFAFLLTAFFCTLLLAGAGQGVVSLAQTARAKLRRNRPLEAEKSITPQPEIAMPGKPAAATKDPVAEKTPAEQQVAQKSPATEPHTEKPEPRSTGQAGHEFAEKRAS